MWVFNTHYEKWSTNIVDIIYKLEELSVLILSLLNVTMNGWFSMVFKKCSCMYGQNHVVVYYLVNMMYSMNRFLNIKPTLHSRAESIEPMFFAHVIFFVNNILTGMFAYLFIRAIGQLATIFFQ